MIATAQLTPKERQILEQGLPHLECSTYVTVSHDGNTTALSTTNDMGAYLLRGSLEHGLLKHWGIGKRFTIQ